MSKELTERDMKLLEYVKLHPRKTPVPDYSEYQALKDNCEFIHTVLKGAHQKITQLENKLEIATKALREIRKRIEDFNDDPMNRIGFMAYGTLHECLKESKKALKEMEGVK